MTELYDMAFPPRTPIIDGLLYSGTHIFAGSAKIGKSFFMLQIAYHIATGDNLWEYPVKQGTVLYLALEDDLGRLQTRLYKMFGVETVDNLHLAIHAKNIEDGLVVQLEEFVQLHPDTNLIIVDTLQKVRDEGDEQYSYAMDYRTITALKAFTDSHNLAVMFVHHTRKMKSDDSFEMISGTNGLMGAADGAFVLQKKKRTEPIAMLQVVGRDQPDQELTLEFDTEHCKWELTKAEKQIVIRQPEALVLKISDFMADKTEWTGTASELLEAVPDLDFKPNQLTKRLNVNVSALFNDCGILYYQNQRSSDRKTFTLRRAAPQHKNDDVTMNDDAIDTSQPSLDSHDDKPCDDTEV